MIIINYFNDSLSIFNLSFFKIAIFNIRLGKIVFKFKKVKIKKYYVYIIKYINIELVFKYIGIVYLLKSSDILFFIAI